MNQPGNKTSLRVVGIAMILIGLLYNIAPVLGVFSPQGSIADQEQVVGPESETERGEVIHTTGNIPSPMAIMNLVLGPIMIAIGLALVMLRRWEMFAAIALIVDMLVKGATILSQLAVGRDISESLVPLALIVVELILTYLILQQWNARRRERPEAAQTGEAGRVL
ncbi:MAG: hypothetical protein DIU68_006820 [Chloroflexota bacterium]|nr:MAG: hypothetical protein DIU68_05655 [Chloroflexota bacterium]